MGSLIEESRLKELMKEALIEIIEERQDMLAQLISEVIQDAALSRALRLDEGLQPLREPQSFTFFQPRA